MLRVTISERAGAHKFVLEGELVRPSVSEAETAWKTRNTTGKRRNWVVDLSGVTLVDESGESLLLQMWREGAYFVGGGVSIREQLKGLGIIVTKRSLGMRNDLLYPKSPEERMQCMS